MLTLDHTAFFYTPLPPYFHCMHPHIQRLLQFISLEEKEQVQRYRLDQRHIIVATSLRRNHFIVLLIG